MFQGSRSRARSVALAGVIGLALAAAPWPAVAQTGITLPGQTTTTAAPGGQTTTTTTRPPSTTTTTAPSAPPLFGDPAATSTTTTTTRPPGEPPPPSEGGDSGTPPPPASPSAGDGGQAPTGAGPFPPELQALTNSIHRTPANNTKKLLFALSPLVDYGLTETQAAIVGFGRFPVAGLASYSHDWWFPRFGPVWRLHQGTDIFAAYGTPVRAPVDGTIKITNGGLGGLSVYVVQPDHTYWYLTHLSGIPEGVHEGLSVTTGDVVGFVGDSGNARGGVPHLHIEIHPGGGGAIDPKSVLDQFIADAIALAPKVVAAYANVQPGTPPAAVKNVVAPLRTAIAPALSPRAALLWTTAVSPTGGAVHLAEAEAARAASSIDWSVRDPNEGTSLFQRQMARRYAAWWMQPLVHPLLARYLALD